MENVLALFEMKLQDFNTFFGMYVQEKIRFTISKDENISWKTCWNRSRPTSYLEYFTTEVIRWCIPGCVLVWGQNLGKHKGRKI